MSQAISLNPPGSEDSYNLMGLGLMDTAMLQADIPSFFDALAYCLSRRNTELYKARVAKMKEAKHGK